MKHVRKFKMLFSLALLRGYSENPKDKRAVTMFST